MDKSYAIQSPPFSLQLSHWDKRVIPIYSKRILCFPLPSTNSEHNNHISHLLLAALQSTVKELPFLAGSIVPFSKEQPWLRDFRPYGAAYLEVKDLSQEVSFLILRKAHFACSLLDTNQLCPLPASVYINDDAVDVCRLRAIFVSGGLLLVVSIIHTVCDGRGISEVLEIFADKLRKAQSSELGSRPNIQEEMLRPTYSFDRNSVLYGNGLRLCPHEDSLRKLPRNDSLYALKQFASSQSSSLFASTAIDISHGLDDQQSYGSDETISISTHDAIAALIWRSMILARRRAGLLSDRTTTHFSQAVDCRSHLNLPEPYFGNAIYGVKASLDSSHLAPSTENPDASQICGLQSAARAIRVEVNGVTADKFRDLLGFVARTDMERLTRLSIVEDISVGSIFLISYFWFGIHELDFGEALGGRIEAFRLPSQGLAPGVPVVLPRLPDGSCEFVINEREEVMRFLAEDEIFQRFTRKQ